MEANGYDPARRYTQEEIDELVAKSPYYKATSNDVDWLMTVSYTHLRPFLKYFIYSSLMRQRKNQIIAFCFILLRQPL